MSGSVTRADDAIVHIEADDAPIEIDLDDQIARLRRVLRIMSEVAGPAALGGRRHLAPDEPHAIGD